MGTRLTVDDDMRAGLEACGLASYDDFISCTQGEIVHQSCTTTTRRILIKPGGIADTLYLKAYHPAPLRGWSRSRPIREARNYVILREHCGVRVPDVIAFGIRRFLGRCMNGFILTRAIPNAESLDQVRAYPAPLRRHLLELTAAIVARMHAAGFFHIDLQWRNLLIADNGAEMPEIHIIDSSRGGLRRGRVLKEHGRLRDLSSLSKEARRRLTPREQIRWLRAYFAVRRLSLTHRALIRTIHYDRGIKDHEAGK
jgi:hypothetical protein